MLTQIYIICHFTLYPTKQLDYETINNIVKRCYFDVQLFRWEQVTSPGTKR